MRLFRTGFALSMVGLFAVVVISCGGGGSDGDTSATYYRDADGDGYGDAAVSQVLDSAQAGWVLDSTDCDDTPVTGTSVNPGASEVCDDGTDNDCSGTADDNCGVVDTSSRSEVTAFYNTYYTTAFGTDSGWTGSTSTCSPGSASVAFRADVLMVINYFRAMAGLPGDVTLDPTLDAKAQDAALMMEANNRLSHIWGDTSGICQSTNNAWLCYTQDGCNAAKSSNLYYHSNQVVAGEVVNLLMEDSGQSTLGHRRWFLYPPQDVMGVGASERYAAIWVFGPWGSRPATPEWIAWPPAGYVPYHVVYDTWSFSGASPASFASATVTVTKDGQNVPVTATELPLFYGDPGVSWQFESVPVFGPGMSDMAYTVTIGGITGMSQSSYTYGVTVYDPD